MKKGKKQRKTEIAAPAGEKPSKSKSSDTMILVG